MGLFRKRYSWDGISPTVYDNKNPDPTNFSIGSCVAINGNLVVTLKYHNCTNFEGNKILVYKGVSKQQFLSRKTIDPHFTEDNLRPFARFEPTHEGKLAAIALAESL